MGCHKLTYLENFPELKVEQSKNFAREKTGVRVLYFGARYYNSDISVWLSVDLLSDFMPWNSPYCYVNNNPLYFIDFNGKIPWPVKKWRNRGWNTKYGFFGEQRKTHKHKGVDINSNLGGNSDLGAPVYSTHSGKIVKLTNYSEDKNGGGTRVTIESENGAVRTVYMHLNAVTVKEGQNVREGQQIGTVGRSGYGKKDAFTAHLHYEVHLKKDGKFEAVNPEEGGRNSGQLIDPQDYVNDILNPKNWPSQRKPQVYSLPVNPFSIESQMNFLITDYNNSINRANNVNRNPIYIQKFQAKSAQLDIDIKI